MEGFRKVALGVTNVEYSQSQKNKVASDIFSFVQEPVLVSMSHFLSAYHNNHWLRNFSWLKMIDSITKVSGCYSRHLSTRAFIMKQHLDCLKINWQNEPEFKSFMDRKTKHATEEKKTFT